MNQGLPKIVVDTSVIINGQLITQINGGSIRDYEIIIPQAVFDELQSQASSKKEKGFLGLEKIKKLQELSGSFGLNITVKGNHPSSDDVKLASSGRIDALIVDMAKQHDAILYTSDRLQFLVAQAEKIDTVFLKSVIQNESLEFLKFFDDQTMSIHLKENQSPFAKKGTPGNFSLVKLDDEKLSHNYLELISSQIHDVVNNSDAGTVEIAKTGASVIQYDDYRIAITTPPFSESFEITIVHPIAKLSLEDYSLSEELMARFTKNAEGIIISGSPGSGKSTLASGLANFYHNQDKIVKTFESPRDLQVNPGVTQYNKLDGSFDNAADILLLVRPDYTIFDEVRRREDFVTFADLRLTGVGMIGVVHANSPLDAIQRFIGKIELGIIPNILDTVVFVKDGRVNKVYELELKVKVPSGMTESDLARPVIEIRNFEDHVLEHEIYTFGEENVIVPITKKIQKVGIEHLAEERIKDVFRRYDPRVEVEILSDSRVKVLVAERHIPSIIGRGGSNINDLEKSLKVHIDVVQKNSEMSTDQITNNLPFSFSESKTAILLTVNKEFTSMHADVLVNDKFITTVKIGKKGQIKIPKRSDTAHNLMNMASSQNEIKLNLKDF